MIEVIKNLINNLGGIAGIVALIWVIQQNKRIQALEKQIKDDRQG